MPIGSVEARCIDQHKTETLVRDRVWSDTLGIGLEASCLVLPNVPGEVVDELVILNLRIRCQGCYEPTYITLPGSRGAHTTQFTELLQTVVRNPDDNTHRIMKSSGSVLKRPLRMVLLELE